MPGLGLVGEGPGQSVLERLLKSVESLSRVISARNSLAFASFTCTCFALERERERETAAYTCYPSAVGKTNLLDSLVR